MNNLKDEIIAVYNRYQDDLINYRRTIHKNPELSFSEKATSDFIKSIFTNAGLEVVPLKEHHSFFVKIEGAGPGRTVGLRAELDALPIQEGTGLSFASNNHGVMHACGHDIHMASVIGSGLIMHELRALWSGCVILVFESGEEQLPGGASAIINDAEFKKIMPHVMFGMHVLPELKVGKVGFCPGRYMASGDEIYLTVKGKGGHAALPHTLVDPVIIASSIILNLQTLVSRSAPSLIPTVLSFGKVEANGATNIIPSEVKIEGTFRTMDEDWRTKACGLIESKAKGIAMSMGGSCNVEIRKGYPSVYNNPELTNKAKRQAEELLGAENVVDLEPRMTTDDFAYFSQILPSVFFRLGVGSAGLESHQLHSSDFIADENSLRYSVPLLCWLLLNNLR